MGSRFGALGAGSWALAIGGIGMVATAPASAQEPAAAAAGEGVQVFEPGFFAIFNPLTAFDMVRQVPGFSIDDGEQRRGFGATAGNVLINGERPSTKASVSSELGRIPAANVERVELIRGGAGDLDVRGRTVVVNVILSEGADAGPTGTYAASLTHNMGGRLGWRGQLTRSFRLAGADVTLDLLLPSGMARSRTDELLVRAGGGVEELRDERYQDNYREIVLSAAAAWKPSPRDAVNLNARGSTWRYDGDELSQVVDAAMAPLRTDTSANEEADTHFFELGADWERQLTPRTSIKLVGLNQDVGWTYAQVFESVEAGGAGETFLVRNPGGRGERIGRATWTWRPDDAHRLEAGVEGAFNFRDSNLTITSDDGSGPVMLVLPVAVTRVEELRGEAFVTDVWTASPELTFEAGFTFEASRITQTGDAEQERELTYPKPRLIATYALDQNDQLRASVERDVAQLNFGEFASSVSLSNDTENIGNPDLEPERTWRARTEWEHRFGERTTVTLAGFYDAVEAVQDFVAIDVDDDGDFDFTGPGNLGDGVRWGGSIEGVAALDAIGIPNAQLKMEGALQRTRVDDPLTGETRSFTAEPDWRYTLDFRQDLPRRRVSWGWDYAAIGERQFFRLDEAQIFDKGEGDLDVFVETTRWGGVTLRFGVDNVFDTVDTNERLFFEGSSRASGVVDRVELRNRRFGQFYTVRVSGTF